MRGGPARPRRARPDAATSPSTCTPRPARPTLPGRHRPSPVLGLQPDRRARSPPPAARPWRSTAATRSRSRCTTTCGEPTALLLQGQAMRAGPRPAPPPAGTEDLHVHRRPARHLPLRGRPAAQRRSTRSRWACTAPWSSGRRRPARPTRRATGLRRRGRAAAQRDRPGAEQRRPTRPTFDMRNFAPKLLPGQREGLPDTAPVPAAGRGHRAAALRQRRHPLPLDGRARRPPARHRARRQPAGPIARPSSPRRSAPARPRTPWCTVARERWRPRAESSTTPACCCTTATPAGTAAC